MNDALRVIGIIVLGLFVLMVVLPLLLGTVGIVVISAISIAVMLIKLAVVVAIGYLILVGIRALMR